MAAGFQSHVLPAFVTAAVLLGMVQAAEGAAKTPALSNPAETIASPSLAAGGGAANGKAAKGETFVAMVCTQLESAARAHNIPEAFLARLIWTESRFDPTAVSPKGAEGIAQFIPATARLRGLDDPFDPDRALIESARFLAELRDEFGNLGLAAAAYNAGQNRVRTWRAGQASLPNETEDYVLAITGLAADDWTVDGFQPAILPLDSKAGFQEACRFLPTRKSSLQRLAKWQPWGVHVAANFSRGQALKTYSRLQKEFGGVLGKRRPMVVSEVNYSMGNRPKHNVRIGADSRREATELCQRLQQAGGHCVVLKN